MDLKQRKEVKDLMQRITKSAAVVKRKAHEFKMNKTAFDEMGIIVDLADEVKDLMETLQQPTPPIVLDGDDPSQLVLGRVTLTPNEEEEKDPVDGEHVE